MEKELGRVVPVEEVARSAEQVAQRCFADLRLERETQRITA